MVVVIVFCFVFHQLCKTTSTKGGHDQNTARLDHRSFCFAYPFSGAVLVTSIRVKVDGVCCLTLLIIDWNLMIVFDRE